jgi:hypothetical protein
MTAARSAAAFAYANFRCTLLGIGSANRDPDLSLLERRFCYQSRWRAGVSGNPEIRLHPAANQSFPTV